MAMRAVKRRISAFDPGRDRLRLAVTLSAGILISALSSLLVIHWLNLPGSLLTIGVFMALLIGQVPHAATAKARCWTTALMIIPLSVGAAVSTSLSSHRTIQILTLVALVGIATWLRCLGPLATSLGFGAFFGFFFPLLLKLDFADLPAFVLVAGIAVASQTAMRALLIVESPGRKFDVLINEFEDVSSNVLDTSPKDNPHSVHHNSMVLARLDAVARALSNWQQAHRTADYLSIDEDRLASRILDARMSVERLNIQIQSLEHEGKDSRAAVKAGVQLVQSFLSSPVSAVAADRVTDQLHVLGSQQSSPALREIFLGLVRCVSSFEKLRSVSHVHNRSGSPAARSHVTEKQHVRRDPQPKKAASLLVAVQRFRRWKEWQPSSRMAVQIMVATACAVFAGEAISASRWYWAVLTVFVIFIGGTSRGGILTRASRRFMGTVFGLAFGVALVYLFQGGKPALVAICVVAAFCMMYLGPLSYTYSAFFITTLLVSMFSLLGVLNPAVVWLRIDETLVGAVIGVLSAYLVFSTNSKPLLSKQIHGYFDTMMRVVDTAFGIISPKAPSVQAADTQNLSDLSPASATSPDQNAALLATVHALDTALQDVEATANTMSTALLASQHSLRAPDIHLLYVGTRVTQQFAHTALTDTNHVGGGSHPGLSVQEQQILDAERVSVRSDSRGAAQALGDAQSEDSPQSDRSGLSGQGGTPNLAEQPVHLERGVQVESDMADRHEAGTAEQQRLFDIARNDLERIQWVLQKIMTTARSNDT